MIPTKKSIFIAYLFKLLVSTSRCYTEAFVLQHGTSPTLTKIVTTNNGNIHKAVVTRSSLSLSSSSKTTTKTKMETKLFAKKYKKVFVAGGSKGVGRCVIDQLVADNIEVHALVRDSSVADELNSMDGVTAFIGNAFVIKDVENAMDGCEAAISTLGGSTADEVATNNQRIDYVGNNHVIESAGILGVTRVIFVRSVG